MSQGPASLVGLISRMDRRTFELGAQQIHTVASGLAVADQSIDSRTYLLELEEIVLHDPESLRTEGHKSFKGG